MKTTYSTHRVLVKGGQYGSHYIPSAIKQYFSVWRVKVRHSIGFSGMWVYDYSGDPKAERWNLSADEVRKLKGNLYDADNEPHYTGHPTGKKVTVITCPKCGDDRVGKLDESPLCWHCREAGEDDE